LFGQGMQEEKYDTDRDRVTKIMEHVGVRGVGAVHAFRKGGGNGASDMVRQFFNMLELFPCPCAAVAVVVHVIVTDLSCTAMGNFLIIPSFTVVWCFFVVLFTQDIAWKH
jgi:hypothetical protein